MNFFDDLEIPFAAHVADGHCRTHIPLYYGIQYNQTGSLELKIGSGQKRTVSGSFAFITHPGAQFSYHLLPGEKHNYHAVCFTGERVRKFLESGLLSLKPVIYPIHDSGRFMHAILELIAMRNIGQREMCVNCVENLLLQIHFSGERKRTVEITPYQCQALKELAEKIRRNYGADWDFSAEAGKIYISERHFRTLFAQINDLPPLHFLLRIRLEKAAERLIHTQETVKSISYECGFQDNFYFSRLFKKYYRLSPQQYRLEFGSFS